MIEGECNSMKHESNEPQLNTETDRAEGDCTNSRRVGEADAPFIVASPNFVTTFQKRSKRIALKWEITKDRNPEH
jgi:hypothetical protein